VHPAEPTLTHYAQGLTIHREPDFGYGKPTSIRVAASLGQLNARRHHCLVPTTAQHPRQLLENAYSPGYLP